MRARTVDGRLSPRWLFESLGFISSAFSESHDRVVLLGAWSAGAAACFVLRVTAVVYVKLHRVAIVRVTEAAFGWVFFDRVLPGWR